MSSRACCDGCRCAKHTVQKTYTLKPCGKHHPWCRECRPEIAEQVSNPSKVARMKMSAARLGGRQTEAHTEAIRAGLIGRPKSEAHRANMSRARAGTRQPKISIALRAHAKAVMPDCACVVHTPPRSPTGIERVLRNIFPEGAPEYHVGTRRCDVALVNDRIDIEADGTYYHDPFFTNTYDVQRDRELIEAGWFVLRLSERFLEKMRR